MNSYKLAIKNIKKSWKDYTVYFLTMIIGVAIFYMFNSIGDQSFMGTLSSSGSEIIKTMVLVIEVVSILVAFVLGFLIVYANHFLIKRRKKEFGVYQMLGMTKQMISKMILGETVIIGLISLAIGLSIGIFGSQFLSILVAKMFAVDVTGYAFVLSLGAIFKTVINFVIIFLVVMVFNTISISKYKLIDLLMADRKAEKKIMKNSIVSIVIFLVSVILLAAAYYRIAFCFDDLSRKELIFHISSGIVSTFLFFWSLSGFMLECLKKAKGMYFKGLNAFVIRQFCASANTSAFSIAVICLLLFLAISAFSLGFSIRNILNKNLEYATPVDITARYDNGKLTDLFQEGGAPAENWLKDDFVEIPIYECSTITYADTLGSIMDAAKEQFPLARWNTPENVISLSDYNRLARLYGQSELIMNDDEYVILCDFALMREFKDKAIEEGNTLKVGNYTLKSAKDSCLDGFLIMSANKMNIGVVILPDVVVETQANELLSNKYFLAGNYLAESMEEKREIDAAFDDRFKELSITNWYTDDVQLAPLTYDTKNGVTDASNGTSVLIIFLVLYIGVVFIISSAALLALKALSDCIDASKRFEILSKIGAGKGMMKRALFIQNAIFFLFPLMLAVIHSAFGLSFAKQSLVGLVSMNMNEMILGAAMTAGVMILIYGGYMLATYLGCKRVSGIE